MESSVGTTTYSSEVTVTSRLSSFPPHGGSVNTELLGELVHADARCAQGSD